MRKPWIKRFILCVVAMAFCLFADCGLDLSLFSDSSIQEAQIDMVYFFQLILRYGLYINVYLILSLVPFTIGYCEEKNDGVYPYAVSRIGYGKYTAVTFLRGTIGAGLAAGLGFLLFTICLSFFKIPFFNVNAVNAGSWIQGAFGELLARKQFGAYLISIMICMIAGHAFWAGVVLCFSTMAANVQVIMVSGLVLSYVVNSVGEILNIPVQFRLDHLFHAQSKFGGPLMSLLVPLAVMFLGLICFGVLFFYRIKKECGKKVHL
ncbi:hypothetical protein [Qiania dongpingensis]|uniref:Uncharacterized protein n=1 Tax=Qiania dongpingensis TaxID=2763669 RepID=A0A7G9G7B9_9FIRM|nr:hypothetical protein [Qiania dongpingensis]QNM06701.1 hypothetical protein H9Q78_06195 [Qiania dongpingensis]